MSVHTTALKEAPVPVVPQQDEIYVFPNEAGTITIAQSRDGAEDGESSMVVFDRGHAKAICEAIMRAERDVRELERAAGRKT